MTKFTSMVLGRRWKRLLPMTVLLLVAIIANQFAKGDASRLLMTISNIAGFAAMGAAVWAITRSFNAGVNRPGMPSIGITRSRRSTIPTTTEPHRSRSAIRPFAGGFSF